jgi:hypothetical protein
LIGGKDYWNVIGQHFIYVDGIYIDSYYAENIILALGGSSMACGRSFIFWRTTHLYFVGAFLGAVAVAVQAQQPLTLSGYVADAISSHPRVLEQVHIYRQTEQE